MRGISALLAALACATSLCAAPMARVAGGALSGIVTPTQPGVSAFLGIPFAAPPIGTLRWAAPKPAARWQGVRAADRFGARCMQPTLYPDQRFRSAGMSEDCLSLNVWAPADARRASKLPVLVYIYGGGFQTGDGSEYRYDGASLAAGGIVVVTINYRLGAFGFLAHPALTAEAGASGNYGLLDQAAALRWVRANIAAFGGDPRHVTVGGESAGSMSVSALMAAPMTRKLIAGAIGESGAVLGPTQQLASLAKAEGAGARFAEGLGATSAAALRAVPAEAILAAQRASRDATFGPIIDGRMIVEDPTATFLAGHEAHVPLLVGSNSEERGAAATLGTDPASVAGYRAALVRLYGARAGTIEELFPAAGDADVLPAATELSSERFLAHTTWRWMDLHRRTGAPTFYYRYDRVRPAALDATWRPKVDPIGAVHSSELEYALGNLEYAAAYAWTDADRAVSTTMRGYWLAFVKTGNPNSGGVPSWKAEPASGEATTRHRIGDIVVDEPFAAQSRESALTELLPPR